jgi:hypothetical protein
MVLATYFTVVVSAILLLIFIYFFGYLDGHFVHACVIYSFASVLCSQVNTLLVKPTLDFEYKILTVSEASGLAVNAFA